MTQTAIDAEKVAGYLRTLQRIPDDIILAIAAQDFDERDNERCVCGWAFREKFARETRVDPNGDAACYAMYDAEMQCADRFGGGEHEWSLLYMGACNDMPNVETAFVSRLDEIVQG